MKFRSLLRTILVNVALVSTVSAVTDNTATELESKKAGLRQVLHTTGIIPQIALLEELVADSAITHATRCGASEPQQSIPSFSTESVVFDTVSNFGDMNELDIEAVRQWYNLPLAQKIHQAEQTSIDTEKFYAAVPAIKQNHSRLRSVKNIIDNTGTIEFIVTIGTEIEYGGLLHSGCIAKAELLTPGKKNREQHLANATRSDQGLTAAILQTEITLELAYLLRNLSEEELLRYETFTASNNAQTFYTTLIDSLEKSFRLASDRINFQNNISALDF